MTPNLGWMRPRSHRPVSSLPIYVPLTIPSSVSCARPSSTMLKATSLPSEFMGSRIPARASLG